MHWSIITLIAIGVLLVIIVIYDLVQKHHAILRNFPVLGHFRYIFEAIGPELRQYIVTNNDEERPFSRDQRRWVYASSKKENNYFGFGTDNDIELTPNYLILKQSTFPHLEMDKGDADYNPLHPIPCAKVMGAARGRKKAFRPRSAVNVSAMSFGSLGSAAVEAINKGCAMAECMHNTGEGGVSIHHQHGGDLIRAAEKNLPKAPNPWLASSVLFGGTLDGLEMDDLLGIFAFVKLRTFTESTGEGFNPAGIFLSGQHGHQARVHSAAEICAHRNVTSHLNVDCVYQQIL